jgi:hypothetical protein
VIDSGGFKIAQYWPFSLSVDDPPVAIDTFARQSDKRLAREVPDQFLAVGTAYHHEADEGVGENVGDEAFDAKVLGLQCAGNRDRLRLSRRNDVDKLLVI